MAHCQPASQAVRTLALKPSWLAHPLALLQLLCREQAVKLWSEREQFERAGVKLVCVVHEWIQREIDGFAPKYWGEVLGGLMGPGACLPAASRDFSCALASALAGRRIPGRRNAVG